MAARIAQVAKERTLRSSQHWIGALMLLAGLGLSGCTPKPTPVTRAQFVSVQTKGDVWKSVASAADQGRIARLASAWSEALRIARSSPGGRDLLRDEGDLLVAGAGLQRPEPTPGSYRCRVVTLGRETKGGPPFERFKPFFCYISLEGDLFTIVKQTGSQRPAGRLWADDVTTRLVFLGTLALGNEEEVRAYGEDARRDMAGVFERIGPFRWRLVIPYPLNGARLEVFELTPVADQPEAR